MCACGTSGVKLWGQASSIGYVWSVLLFVLYTPQNVALMNSTSVMACGTVIRAGMGLLRSPALPYGIHVRYPDNLRCEWTIVAPKSRRVKIDFSVFDLQASNQCRADYLEIILDSQSNASDASSIHCGTKLPASMVSTGHVLRLLFVTDESLAGTGFNLFYDTVAVDTPDAPSILWLEQNLSDSTAKLQSLPADPADYLTSGNIITTTKLQYQPANWTALATDYHNRYIFWSDPRLKLIWRGEVEGAQLTALPMYGGTSSMVNGIAVDWLARTVYWTDATYNWIMVSNYDGSKHLAVINEDLYSPSGIAVHPLQGLLFWTDKGSEPKIERSRLDGQDRRVLVGSEAGYPVAITIDYPLDRIFWTAYGLSGTSSIYSASIHGDSMLEHIRNDYTQFILNDLTIFKKYLFVSDSTNQLHCYQKDATSVAHYFSFNLASRRPFGLTTYAVNNQAFGSSGCDTNPCEYLCVSGALTKHRCLCKSGYQALQNGSCHQGSDTLIKPELAVVFRDSICMYPDNLPDIAGSDMGQCILRNLPDATAITSDARDGQLFYSTNEYSSIYSVRLRNNEAPMAVVGGTGGVHGIAVDWLTKHLYWTDSVLNHLAVARYNGRDKKILIRTDMVQPGSIAIDPHERFVFWTYMNAGTRIERAGLDGTGRTVILREVMQPRGISLDYHSKTLYFVDRGTGTIQSIDYIGRGHKLIFRKNEATFTGLDLYKDYLIWTEGSPNNELNVVNLETGKYVLRLPLTAAADSAHGVAMYADSRQPQGQNSCTTSSHGCQQLCLPLPLPYDFVCACAIGYTLLEDGAFCSSYLVNDNFVLVTDTHLHGIYQVDLSTSNPELQALLLVNMSNPISVEYDPLQGLVYWSDVTHGTISRSLLAGGNQEVILAAGQGQVPYSIVVDSNSRLLYWTDIEANNIRVCRLDGTYQRTLLNSSGSPRALAILPNDGLLFWSWWGEDGAGVGKAWMDGDDMDVLVSEEGGFFHGLTVDAIDRRLYWSDSRVHTIESMNLDTGSDRQTLPLGVSSSPFGLMLMAEYIYWTDQGSRKLMRADKKTGLNVMTIGSLDLATPNGIHGQGNSPNIVNNACSLGNGGCGGLCLPTPIGRTCACADGISATEDGACSNDGHLTDADIELAFTSQPQDITLVIGMEISQKCSSNQPTARVVWKKDFVPLPLGLSQDVYVLTDGILMILDVDETHRGLYTCTITGTNGKVIESTAEFQFNPDDIFRMTPKSVVIPEGDDYILTCATNQASYVIRWEKNSRPVQQSDMVHVISGDSLVIREAIVSNSGKYTCVIQTLAGVRVAEATAQVSVTSQQTVEEVCGRVTSIEAVGRSGVANDTEEDRTFRVTGGLTAERGSSPWIVRLWHNQNRKHYCGGTLLNRYWVLTGAHCITQPSVTKNDIKIRLGDHDSDSTDDSERLFGVQHIKVYDKFVASDYDSDLALIKLAEPVNEFNDYIRPVCLPTKTLARMLLKPGVKGKVVGWGKIDEDGPYPRYLAEVEVPVIGQRKCVNSTRYLVTENMFCAGYKNKQGDACKGDSGGPFSMKHRGRWYQLGIVSWGEGCDRDGKYGFYTRLVKFFKWINMYMQDH